ncbi:MAG: hypothetical protein TEF_13670 [Rhizobiales bacterium NRL2]|jgi:hypothetical protein|nr:MAG: hypothetical protein TEF_13670 [Rhizobiales bacterium NRL2]
MNQQIIRTGFGFAAMLVLALALSGCDSARGILGLEKTSPDESRVTVFSPLVVPPEFSLRPPGSGGVDQSALPRVNRPQQRAVITADGRVVGGVDGSETVPDDATVGELALLRQAGALTPPRGVRGLAAQQERALERLNTTLTDLVLFDRSSGETREATPQERATIEKPGLF